MWTSTILPSRFALIAIPVLEKPPTLMQNAVLQSRCNDQILNYLLENRPQYFIAAYLTLVCNSKGFS